MRLQIGLGPAGKVFAVLVCAFVSTIALVVTGQADALPVVDQWGPRLGGPGDLGIWDKVIAGTVLAVCTYGILHALRYGVRLDGTTVTVRGAFTTTRVNLAAAHRFGFDQKKERTTHRQGSYEVHTTYLTPLLCAQDRQGTVRIPLSYYGRSMRKPDYRALAVAIFKGQRYCDPQAAAQAADAIRAFGCPRGRHEVIAMTTNSVNPPDAPPTGYREAIALFQAGKFAQARDILRRCVEENPAHVGARFGLGVCTARLGDRPGAVQHLQRVVELDPRHVPAHLQLAELYDTLGRRQDALALYRSVLSIEPGNRERRVHRARLSRTHPEQWPGQSSGAG